MLRFVIELLVIFACIMATCADCKFWSYANRRFTCHSHGLLSDTKTCAPEAKFIKELDFDVKTRLSPPKSAENCEKRLPNRNFLPIFLSKKVFRRQKIENCKSFETRFAEVSRRLELSLGGKR